MSFLIHIPDFILYEDDYVLLVDKPHGLMVEPDRNGYPNLLDQVKKYLKSSLLQGEDFYVQHIHRLDRPVSGVVLFAKQKTVLRNLSEQFAERKVKKYYKALTEHLPSQLKGTIEHWHRKEKKKAMLTEEALEYSEKAKLEYGVQKIGEQQCLWNIELHTGKYHQIRAQLASRGCPIIGDILYGSRIPYKEDAIALNAYELIFKHPVTQHELRIQSRFYL